MLKIAAAKNSINFTHEQMQELADLTDGYSLLYSVIRDLILQIWSMML